MATIGENIRNARKALKMSQEDLASAIGANRVTISSYENGVYLPSVPALKRLATALQTSPEVLTTISESHGDIVSVRYAYSPKDLSKKTLIIDSESSLDEALRIRERLRRDPNYRILFDAADKAAPEHIRAAAEMLKALEKNNDEY